MADEPYDTDPGTEAAVTSRDWRAELAGATGARPDDPSAAPPARSPLPASWDPGAGTADPHLRAHARPMATSTVEPADEPAGALLPQRLVEALATVIGRRLDGIDARLHALTAPGGPAGEPSGGSVVGAERLEATVMELVRTASRPVASDVVDAPSGVDAHSPALLERLDALAAGIERTASAAAVADLTAAVSALAVGVAGLERQLGESVPPAGAATVEDVLERLELLEPPAGPANTANVLDPLDDNVAPPSSGPTGGSDLAKVLGGRLDAVVARFVHLEAAVRHALTHLDAGSDGPDLAGAGPMHKAGVPDMSIIERLERQINELNSMLR
jgi:hypothetical protein